MKASGRLESSSMDRARTFLRADPNPQEEMRTRIRRLFDVSDKKVARPTRSSATERSPTLPGSKMQGSITEEHIEGVLDWLRTILRSGPAVQSFEGLRDGVRRRHAMVERCVAAL